MNSSLEVYKDDLLPIVLDKAYEVLFFRFCSFLFTFLSQIMKLAPHIPIERCRLVKYNYFDGVMDQSLDFDEVS